MAEVSLPTTVTADAAATLRQGTAGATIAAGEVVYLNSTTGRLAVADADASAAAAAAVGIALNGASTGQPVTYIVEGDLTGSGLKGGQVYLLANTAGDLASGNGDLTEDTSFVTIIGVGVSTTVLRVKITVSGVVSNLA